MTKSVMVDYRSKFMRHMSDACMSVVKACQVLAEANKNLSVDDFKKLCSELKIEKRDSERLVRIGNDQRLKEEQIQQRLPNTWTVLDRISSLEDEQFEKALKQGVINPLATRASIDAFKKAATGEQVPEKTDQPDNAYRIATIWLDKSKATTEVVEKITKRLADKLKELENEISAGELVLTDHGVAEKLKPNQKQIEKATAKRKRNEEKALRILTKAVKKAARLQKQNTSVHHFDVDLKEAINCLPDYETVQAAISTVHLKVNLDECIENPEIAEEFYKKMVEREKKGLPVL